MFTARTNFSLSPNARRDTVLPIRQDWPARPSTAQVGVTLRSEKKDSLPMSTNRPMLPAAGADLVSVSLSASVPLTAAVRRVPSMSILRLVHSSGPMSAPAS
jgi:hypothetical protein